MRMGENRDEVRIIESHLQVHAVESRRTNCLQIQKRYSRLIESSTLFLIQRIRLVESSLKTGVGEMRGWEERTR